MSYGDGEAVVLRLIQELGNYSRANATRGDWKLLNSGASDHYAILRPGAFTVTADALSGENITQWRTVIEVWQRWRDDTPTLVALEARVSELIAHLSGYPSLNGVALMAAVVGGSEMQRRWIEQGGPLWAAQEVYVDWQEERFYSISE